MMRGDDRARLQHMLDHAIEAVELSAKRERADLDADRLFNLAMVRLVEIIGEAGSRISADTQQRDPTVQWQSIRSMRNRLIHGYDGVDFDILWDVIRHDLPELINKLERLLQ